MDKISCTAAILTFNSEKTIRKALESVKNFDEIIVCDGGSSDNTVSIAKEYGASVIIQDAQYKNLDGGLANYAGARNQQLSAAKNKWFFYIDSDEYLSKEGSEEIKNIVQSENPEVYAWWQPRKYVVDDKIIDCATTYPNKQMRLFHRDHVNKFIRTVHERIELKPNTPVGTLKEFELVPFGDLKAIKRKWDKCAVIETCQRDQNSWFENIRSLFFHLKVSLLYLVRYTRILLFCRKNRMPFQYELVRQWYTISPVGEILARIFKIR